MSRTAQHIIMHLKQDIADGILKPGDQLEESMLSERFDVSRTPIREAIRSMVDCGLLTTRPRKGAFVRVLSAKELTDLFELAAELEAMASKLAARSPTRDIVNTLEQALEQCHIAAKNDKIKEYAKANLNFHHAIHQASNNDWLVKQLENIELHINFYRALPYEIMGRLTKSFEEHQEIYFAIINGKTDEARTLTYDHMMLQGQRIPSILQALGNESL